MKYKAMQKQLKKDATRSKRHAKAKIATKNAKRERFRERESYDK